MFVRKKFCALILAALFLLTGVPSGSAATGIQVRDPEVSAPTGVSTQEKTELLAAFHKKIEKGIKKGAKKVGKGVKKVGKAGKWAAKEALKELNRMVLVCKGNPACQTKIKLYQGYMIQLRAGVKMHRLPKVYREVLAPFYPQLKNLNGYRFGYSKHQPKGNATTDCSKTYYNNKSYVNKLKRGELQGWQFKWLFHEIQHYNQCKRVAGRDRYALMWFRDLEIGVVKGANLKQLHDLMPMEQDANSVEDLLWEKFEACCRDSNGRLIRPGSGVASSRLKTRTASKLGKAGAPSKLRKGRTASKSRKARVASKLRKAGAPSKFRKGRAASKTRKARVASKLRKARAPSKLRKGRAASKTRKARVAPKFRKGDITSRPLVVSVKADASRGGSASIVIINGKNFNPKASKNRIRIPGRRNVKGKRTWKTRRAHWVNPAGTQLRVRLPKGVRRGRLAVHNGKRYSSYFRFRVGKPSARPATRLR